MNLVNSRNLKALLASFLLVTVSFTLGPISPAQSKTDPYPISFSKSAEDYHTCAVTNEHKVRCWLWTGRQGGEGISYPYELSQLSNVSKIAMGDIDCLVRLDTSVQCSGAIPQPAGMSAAKDIAVDGNVVCILNTNRNLLCWNLATDDGIEMYWQTLETPVQMNEVDDFSVAGGGLCAVVTGKLSCWSSAFDAKERQPMSFVPDNLSSARDVEMSSHLVCAITKGNVAECWTKYSDLDVKAPAAVKNTKTLKLHRETVCAISVSSVLRCWGNTNGDEFGISPQVTGIKNMSLDDHLACLVFQDNTSWCKTSKWEVDGNRISFDPSVKSEIAAGSEVLISGRVRVSQFAVPKTALVRSKKGQNSNWSSWKTIPIQTSEGYIFTYDGLFSFKHKIDLTTIFQVRVFESEVKGVLPKTATFTVQAIPKLRKFTYTVKRNYINNFLQGATVSYSIKTDPRYQGACTASAETNRALNFALTDLGKYKTSSYSTVVNGVCSGKINIRYNGEYKITVVAVSKSFTSLSNQTKILLKASG